MDMERQRREIIDIAKRLYDRGLMPGSDGNISIRLDDEHVLITPSRLPKGFLLPDDLIVLDLEGNQISGELPPSLEAQLHLCVYRKRNDAKTVIHAHPSEAIALTLCGLGVLRDTLPEVEVIFPGGVPVVPYILPGSAELGRAVGETAVKSDAMLLARHGTVTIAKDLLRAWLLMEQLAASAAISLHAFQLGNPSRLNETDLKQLRKLRTRVEQTSKRSFTGEKGV